MNIKFFATPLWLITQLIIFPILILIIMLKTAFAFCRSNAALTLAIILSVLYIPVIYPFFPIPVILTVQNYTIILYVYSIFILTNMYNKSPNLAIYLIATIFSATLIYSHTSVLGPITIFSTTVYLNMFLWSYFLTCSAYNFIYNTYDIPLSDDEEKTINDLFLKFMIPEQRNGSSNISISNIFKLINILASQEKYETALTRCEQEYLHLIKNTKKNVDRNFMLCKLAHIMKSKTLTLNENETITKIDLTPSWIQWLDSPYFMCKVENSSNGCINIIFAGTSILPKPCPSPLWTFFANFTPGLNIGEPILFVCGEKIQAEINKLENKKVTLSGFSLGGSIAKLVKESLNIPSNSSCEVITFAAPGKLSWKNRSIYFLSLALLWLGGSLLFQLLVSGKKIMVLLPLIFMQSICGIPYANTIAIGIMAICSLAAIIISYQKKRTSNTNINITEYFNPFDIAAHVGDFCDSIRYESKKENLLGLIEAHLNSPVPNKKNNDPT